MKNTIEYPNARDSLAKKSGAIGVSGAREPKSPPKIARGVIDQYGHHWVLVHERKARCWIKTIDLASGGKASSLLDRAGIVQLTAASLKILATAAEGWTSFKKATVIDRPGWHNGVYMHGSSDLVRGAIKQSTLINAVLPIEKYRLKGSVKSWLTTFTPFLAGQDFLLVALGYSYLGPLLDVLNGTEMRISNPILDLCGGTSTGKTTGAIRLPGSCWGYGDAELGFGESWFATASGLVEIIADHRSEYCVTRPVVCVVLGFPFSTR